MKKILIIEDESTTVVLLRKLLEGKGYEVVSAGDGMEGYVMIKEENPHLIILDVHMPNLDGYGLIREINETKSKYKIPIIVMTANEGLEEKFKTLGVAHYFTKPFDTAKLLEAVNGILNR